MHIENINLGNRVIVVDVDFPTIEENQLVIPMFDGIPWKVVAIQAPFLLCQYNDSTTLIDTRRVSLTKAGRSYVYQFNKYYKENSHCRCPKCNSDLVRGTDEYECQTCETIFRLQNV